VITGLTTPLPPRDIILFGISASLRAAAAAAAAVYCLVSVWRVALVVRP